MRQFTGWPTARRQILFSPPEQKGPEKRDILASSMGNA
jgi:hypothetical protein